MGLLGLLKTQFLCHLVICYVFLLSGLIVNLVQICTLPLWCINKQLARKLNCRLAYCVSSQMVAVLEWWSGTECTLYTDPESYLYYGKENAIVILNHNFEIDFLCGWTFCERFGVLGSSKVLAKKELAYVPIIGWMWYFLEIVFCKRKWEDDRRTVTQSLKRLQDYPENFWFLLYCEGTRFTEKKHKISMEVAEKKGLPKLKYHLLPRTKGFCVTVQNLRGKETTKHQLYSGCLMGKSTMPTYGFLWTQSQRTSLNVPPGSTNSTRKRMYSRNSTVRQVGSLAP
ncbi:1-acyl-sn-glycerol-3-phosphate acyltransferase delta isoform X3 [Hoplias malabaricus]|uniref:1-acyl-sn-glycerol-3-phosphate acyltransferase delta isoform X3 n=1 Tax=Hoplias malabaricus TaxID=27720 RepID=UPI003461C656